MTGWTQVESNTRGHIIGRLTSLTWELKRKKLRTPHFFTAPKTTYRRSLSHWNIKVKNFCRQHSRIKISRLIYVTELLKTNLFSDQEIERGKNKSRFFSWRRYHGLQKWRRELIGELNGFYTIGGKNIQSRIYSFKNMPLRLMEVKAGKNFGRLLKMTGTQKWTKKTGLTRPWPAPH